jgi:hypothetical protein
MKCLPILLALPLLAGCPSTGDQNPEATWEKIDLIGDEVLVLLDDQILLWAHDPEAVENLTRVRAAVEAADRAVHAYVTTGGELSEALDYVEVAIALVDTLRDEVDPEDKDVVATLSGIRNSLGILRIALS